MAWYFFLVAMPPRICRWALLTANTFFTSRYRLLSSSFKRWETSHTVIDGRRLYFDGTAAQLFGSWIKWLLLTIITIGIYGFWVGIKMKQWVTLHTHCAN